MSYAMNMFLIVFIITTIEIHKVKSGLGKGLPKREFMALKNESLTERLQKLVTFCLTSFSSWMVLLG
ncbi:unnamed protein product [Heterobilharzia americana]|nr:unnamed protein product [Heterobilharzia americana]